MAYTQRSISSGEGGDNTLLWVGGLGALAYLYYKGYFSSLFSAQAQAPSSSVNSGSTLPTVTQLANNQPIRRSPSVLNPQGSVSPLSLGLDQATIDLANESYYTWRASGEPLSKLAEINAAYDKVHNYYEGSIPTTNPIVNVNSGAVVPNVSQVAQPLPPSVTPISSLPIWQGTAFFNASTGYDYTQPSSTPPPTNYVPVRQMDGSASSVASGGTGVAVIPPPAIAPPRIVTVRATPVSSGPMR